MENTSVRPADGIEKTIKTYGNMLFRICLVMLKNPVDAEDAVQETMLKYIQKTPEFESSDHEKAWLIKVASNKCRDILKSRWRNVPLNFEMIREYSCSVEDSRIMEALMSLPDKFRIVMTLYYVEEYRVDDIAKIIGKTSSCVKMRLQKGRKLLEERYRREYLNDGF